jgi:hypothetical protein
MQDSVNNPATIPFLSAAPQIAALKSKNDKQKTIEKDTKEGSYRINRVVTVLHQPDRL